MNRYFAVAVVLIVCLGAGAPGIAQEIVLLDTFDDDVVNDPPNGPEIGSYYQLNGNHLVTNFGSGDLRLWSYDYTGGVGYLVYYKPTDFPGTSVSEYMIRVEGNSQLSGQNALYQQLTLRPLGLNLTLRWGDDMLWRLVITRPGEPSETLTLGSWAFDTDYHVIWSLNDDTDWFTLHINGVEILDQSIGYDLEYLGYLGLGAGLAGTKSQIANNVRITSYDCQAATPPIAELTLPAELGSGCACDPVTVEGSAYDPDDDFNNYVLDYRRTGALSWTQIHSSTSPVISDTLGTWSTASLAQGYYLLRLTVTNDCGLSSTAVQTVFVDGGFDSLELRYPTAGQVVARNVCLDGTVYESWCFHYPAAGYTAEYRPSSGGDFTPVEPGTTVYDSTVVNDPFARWDTVGLSVPDGNYELLVTAWTDCGHIDAISRQVVVDNTPPIAEIISPTDCEYVEGNIVIVGTADDANHDHWVLEYTGGPSSGWTTITTGTTPVVYGVLGTWDTTLLPACAYTLRLRVYDRAVLDCGSAVRQRTDAMISVNVGNCGDFDVDDDGDVDLYDFAAFQAAFTGPLP